MHLVLLLDMRGLESILLNIYKVKFSAHICKEGKNNPPSLAGLTHTRQQKLCPECLMLGTLPLKEDRGLLLSLSVL